jgi:hypothetical protein
MRQLFCNVCNQWIKQNGNMYDIPVYRCKSAFEGTDKGAHGFGCHICHTCFNNLVGTDKETEKAFKEIYGVSLRNWLNKPAHCPICAGKLEKI